MHDQLYSTVATSYPYIVVGKCFLISNRRYFWRYYCFLCFNCSGATGWCIRRCCSRNPWYHAGGKLSVDSIVALDESEKCQGSPQLQNAKQEYELGLSDFNKAGGYMVSGVKKTTNGDSTGDMYFFT